MNPSTKKDRITYTVRGPDPKRNGCYIVWEHQDGAAVNEYTAYDRGQNFVLYPRRKLIPSTVELKKQTINIFNTRRDF